MIQCDLVNNIPLVDNPLIGRRSSCWFFARSSDGLEDDPCNPDQDHSASSFAKEPPPAKGKGKR